VRPAAAVVTAALVPLVASGVVAASAAGATRPHPWIFLDKPTLAELRSAAKSRTPAFRRLQARCDLYLRGRVEWPTGKDYPPDGSIGEGYQGDGYFSPALNLGLCFQALRSRDASRARRYAAKGADLLTKMSELGAKRGVDPLRDSGYGVRFFGSGMALAYDWLYPALAGKVRARVVRAVNAWIAAYERGGFGRDFPQGNYFAGYYAAKAYAALATEGDNPKAGRMWSDWLRRVHGRMVQPYYAKELPGGGWPEGWNYGWIGTLNMSLPALAAKTAKGIDLVRRKGAPFTFPLGSARYLLHFTWPDLTTVNDADAVYDSDNPTATQPWMYTLEAGLLRRLGDRFAAVARDIARAVGAANPGARLGEDWEAWVGMLFGGAGGRSDYRNQPLSYRAPGMDDVAMRSSWSRDAVWVALSGGPYVNNPDNGEEYFDKGSLAIVNGSRPFLVNATAALLRNTPGTGDGSPFYNPVYEDLFGDGETHGLFNVFYVDRPTPTGQGNRLRREGAKTRVDAFDDATGSVFVRDTGLEDMYPQRGGRTIAGWTRELAFVRPRLCFVFDRTRVTDASLDQRMAFHFPRGAAPTGGDRFDVGGPAYAGSVTAVLPAAPRTTVSGVLGGQKVVRLDVRPGSSGADLRWLTVFDAAPSPGDAATVTPLAVSEGDVVGAVASGGAGNVAAAFGASGRVSGDAAYSIPAAATKHLVADLEPGGRYGVSVTPRAGATLVVRVSRGGDRTASGSGVLRFTTTAAGAIAR
jgi:hypothetical protein